MGPPTVAKQLPIRSTRASRAGINYKAANGTKITNYGEKRLEGINKGGKKTGITIQVADVSKTLGSVGKMTEAENTIIFSKGRSIITSDPGGKIAEAAFKQCRPEITTELEKKNGVYTFDMWVPTVSKAENNYCQGQGGGGDNYHNVGSVSGFAWLDDEVL